MQTVLKAFFTPTSDFEYAFRMIDPQGISLSLTLSVARWPMPPFLIPHRYDRRFPRRARLRRIRARSRAARSTASPSSTARTGAPRCHRHDAGRARSCRPPRRRAGRRTAARPAARHPGAGQGQYCRHRCCRHGRVAGAGRGVPAARCVRRGAIARGRRGDRRQDQPQRVVELPLVALNKWLERAWRAGAQPASARPHALRVQPVPGCCRGRLRSGPIGTETDGSIVSPATANGVVGTADGRVGQSPA